MDYTTMIAALREQYDAIGQAIAALVRLQGTASGEPVQAEAPKDTDNAWMLAKDAAAEMGVHPSTITSRIRTGLMRGRIVRDGQFRRAYVSRHDVDTYADLHPTSPRRKAAKPKQVTTKATARQDLVILDVLLKAGRPLRLQEVTAEALAAGLPTRSPAPSAVIGQLLNALKKKGLVAHGGNGARNGGWVVTPGAV